VLSNPVGATMGAPNNALLRINDTANQFRNTAPIDLFSGAVALPYPSQITVSGLVPPAFRIRVTLYDYYTLFPDNIDVLLVGPNGAKYVLMADAGGLSPIAPNDHRTLTFVDSATALVPDNTLPVTGKYLPVNWETPVTAFPAPAPGLPYVEPGNTVTRPVGQTLFGNFGGFPGNGVWSLFVRDDNGFPLNLTQKGSISGGWGLEILPATAAGVDVTGRVTTPDGRGLRNAVVYMTDANGETRTAVTSSFGYFRFENVRVSESYVMGVNSRLYRFTPRVVTVLDTLTDVDFVGIE
jgi:hypothetical protein